MKKQNKETFLNLQGNVIFAFKLFSMKTRVYLHI